MWGRPCSEGPREWSLVVPDSVFHVLQTPHHPASPHAAGALVIKDPPLLPKTMHCTPAPDLDLTSASSSASDHGHHPRPIHHHTRSSRILQVVLSSSTSSDARQRHQAGSSAAHLGRRDPSYRHFNSQLLGSTPIHCAPASIQSSRAHPTSRPYIWANVCQSMI